MSARHLSPQPHVTDHAVVRYCQRGCGLPHDSLAALRAAGVNVDRVRRAISDVVAVGVQVGAVTVLKHGLRFILEDEVCVSVILDEGNRCSMHPDIAARRRAERQAGARR